MRNFLYSFVARIVFALASFLTAKLTAGWPWLVRQVGLDKEVTTLLLTIVLFFIVEVIFTLKPQIDLNVLKKTRKRIADAIFDEWRKNLKFADGTDVKGIRINVLLFKWSLIPNLSRFPFKKWVVAYKDEGLMKSAPDRKIELRADQGAVGRAFRTDDGNTAHVLDLLNHQSEQEKMELLTKPTNMDGLGLTPKQAAITKDILAVVTVLLVEKNKVVGAFNVDATETLAAKVLIENGDVQKAIKDLSVYADKIFCKGDS